MSIEWQKSLDALRNDFRDASRSYPKLFHAHLVGPIVSHEIWKGVLGEQRFLRYGDRPISDEILDQSCIYSPADSDERMCKHALTRFDTLAQQAAKALFEIPRALLGFIPLELLNRTPSPLHWLAFLDQLGSHPAPPDSIRGFRRDQYKILRSEDQGASYLIVSPHAGHRT